MTLEPRLKQPGAAKSFSVQTKYVCFPFTMGRLLRNMAHTHSLAFPENLLLFKWHFWKNKTTLLFSTTEHFLTEYKNPSI